MSVSIRVLAHAAIRLQGEKVLYFDPFHLEEAPKDGDLIFVTHEHYDHFSPEDIRRAAAAGALLIAPRTVREAVLAAGFSEDRLLTVKPGEKGLAEGIAFEAVPAYNVGKNFHRPEKEWVGYIVTLEGRRYFVAGDTDRNPDNAGVRCDVAFVPVGGTYTMTASEAAAFVNELKPQTAVPIHYGDIVGTEADAEEFCRLTDPAVSVCRFR